VGGAEDSYLKKIDLNVGLSREIFIIFSNSTILVHFNFQIVVFSKIYTANVEAFFTAFK
jgi:hypothetical protein